MNYNCLGLVQTILYYLYEKRLARQIRKGSMPAHLGFILDGNRRYAKEMGFDDVADGHREGARRLDDLLQWCADLDIDIVTVWVFSPENFRRNPEEVDALFTVIRDKMDDLAHNHVVTKNRFRVKAFGNIEGLPEDVRMAIERCEKATSTHEGRMLNIAVGYGGREEIVEAVKKAARGKRDGIRGGADRRPDRGGHNESPLHVRDPGPGPHHQDKRRDTTERLSFVAKRLQRVLLLRRPLAGLQEDRFPPCHTELSAPGQEIREVEPVLGQ